MTHDELLAKINEAGINSFESDSNGWLALLDIVNMHRPYEMMWHSLDTLACDGCGQMYPCQTILAIESKL